MAYELLGKNFTPPDVHAKVTGRAKYSEDIRADGMVFVKLLTSPMPHARVTSIDASAALALPGVHGVLTADELTTNPPEPQETILTNEPLFVGHPILAVAADTEELASDALEQIKVTYEELPFTVDPLQSLYPGGPNARTNGNVANQGVDLKQPFAVTYDGYINVPADGLYEFQVDSTWDATVVLAGEMIIDDAGSKDRKVKSAVTPLKKGMHRVSIRYNHRGGDAAFRIRYGIKGQGLRQAGGGEFVH